MHDKVKSILPELRSHKYYPRFSRMNFLTSVTASVPDVMHIRPLNRHSCTLTKVSPSREGTTHGGPLSLLLSNVMLYELEKELERLRPRFCRYADDCNIYVKSKKSGKWVMDYISQFIEKRLKLKVNQEKSAVDYPTNRKFLGFGFYCIDGVTRIRVHSKTLTNSIRPNKVGLPIKNCQHANTLPKDR